jgi:predicted transcriptional regulator
MFKKYKTEDMLNLIDEGYTQQDVAKKLGCDHSIVWRRLQKISKCKTYGEFQKERIKSKFEKIIMENKDDCKDYEKEIKIKFEIFTTFFIDQFNKMNDRINHIEKVLDNTKVKVRLE